MSALEPGDLGLDISPEAYYRAPRPAKLQHSKTGYERFEETYQWVLSEAHKSRTGPDPLIGARALVTARDTFALLARNGYPSFVPLLHEMQLGVEALARMFRRELTKRLLTRKIDDDKAAECLRELSGIIERGDWPEWEKDFDEVENEIAASLTQRST